MNFKKYISFALDGQSSSIILCSCLYMQYATGTYKSSLTCIESAQHRAVKTILKMPYRTLSSILCDSIYTLKLAVIREIKNLLFNYLIHNFKPLQHLGSLFIERSLVVHTPSTRQPLEDLIQHSHPHHNQIELSFITGNLALSKL